MTVANIELTNIEEELARISEHELGKDKIRACLFNLIVYTQKTKRTPYYEDMIKKVIAKFPCRIIWIAEEKGDSNPYLKTSVSSETVSEGETKIFCEQIKIEVSGPLKERVPYILLPYIIPDLPIYVFWTQDPTLDTKILPYLLPIANRVIFDSEEITDLQTFSKTALKLLSSKSSLSDINWVAMRGWRDIFRNVFCNQELLFQLIQSKIIRIAYNKKEEPHCKFNEVKSAYFQGWLAAQLNWKFQNFSAEENHFRLVYKRALAEVAILLIPMQEEKLPSGAILSVEVESALNKAHYVFTRSPLANQIKVQFSDESRCDLPCSHFLGGLKPGHELIEEIFFETTGEHYKNMLEVISQIPWRHACK